MHFLCSLSLQAYLVCNGCSNCDLLICLFFLHKPLNYLRAKTVYDTCIWKWKSVSRVWLFSTHGLYSPWNSPGQSTGVGSLSLLQGIFPTLWSLGWEDSLEEETYSVCVHYWISTTQGQKPRQSQVRVVAVAESDLTVSTPRTVARRLLCPWTSQARIWQWIALFLKKSYLMSRRNRTKHLPVRSRKQRR